MRKLVDAEYLKQEYLKHSFFPAIISRVLKNAPEIELVFCEECGWYRPECETCSFWPDEGYRHPKHFCGEGKPR